MTLLFKQILEKIVRKRAPGPSPTFSIFHILYTLQLLAERTMGRSKLAERLGVGEGVIRSLIGRLKNADLIAISKRGCTLTSEGRMLWDEYKTIFKRKIQLGKSTLTLADYNFAVLAKNLGHKIGTGIEQRDAAIIVGARGATTIMFDDGRLKIPTVSDNLVEDFPKPAKRIVKLLQPEENDAIIIGSADSSLEAEYATLAAAWTLLGDCT